MKVLVTQTDNQSCLDKYGLQSKALTFDGRVLSDPNEFKDAENEYMIERFFSEVEVNSFEDLTKLIEAWKEPVIVDKAYEWDVSGYEYKITIWNGYIG